MTFLYLFLIKKFENDPVDKNRFKDFGDIQRQRIATLTGGMQLADRGIELRLMNGT